MRQRLSRPIGYRLSSKMRRISSIGILLPTPQSTILSAKIAKMVPAISKSLRIIRSLKRKPCPTTLPLPVLRTLIFRLTMFSNMKILPWLLHLFSLGPEPRRKKRIADPNLHSSMATTPTTPTTPTMPMLTTATTMFIQCLRIQVAVKIYSRDAERLSTRGNLNVQNNASPRSYSTAITREGTSLFVGRVKGVKG
ncbi:hypothetical protein F4819DRAFT_463863 [Hypoxylon fuscum]|nr:hypothetical protein F4819DRAFT_463863 [Hypoxylon fuscum]